MRKKKTPIHVETTSCVKYDVNKNKFSIWLKSDHPSFAGCLTFLNALKQAKKEKATGRWLVDRSKAESVLWMVREHPGFVVSSLAKTKLDELVGLHKS